MNILAKAKARFNAWLVGPLCSECGGGLAPIGRFTKPFCWCCAGLLDRN